MVFVHKKIELKENEKYLYDLLGGHHQEKIGTDNDAGKNFSYAMYDEATYIGGITGRKWHDEVHVSLLAVNKNYRGQGIGKKLMSFAEQFATDEQAKIITITTQDYQAIDFYQSLNYEIFGQLADCPFAGTTRYYLYKRI